MSAISGRCVPFTALSSASSQRLVVREASAPIHDTARGLATEASTTTSASQPRAISQFCKGLSKNGRVSHALISRPFSK